MKILQVMKKFILAIINIKEPVLFYFSFGKKGVKKIGSNEKITFHGLSLALK